MVERSHGWKSCPPKESAQFEKVKYHCSRGWYSPEVEIKPGVEIPDHIRMLHSRECSAAEDPRLHRLFRSSSPRVKTKMR